jgi:hypothetical protein
MTQTQFEDRLLAELRQVVAERPASGVRAAPRRRPTRLVVGSVTATAIVAGAVLAATLSWGGDVTPAFAVDRKPDGTITVKINRLSDAAALEAKLRAAGVSAVVHFAATPAKICRPPGKASVPRAAGPVHVASSVSAAPGRPATFSITRNMVRPGQTLLMTTGAGKPGPDTLALAVVNDPVPSCMLKDAAAPPPGGSFSTAGNVAGGSGVPNGAPAGAGIRSLHVGP